jgi:DNA-directed RNA polymerase subunit K/omega
MINNVPDNDLNLLVLTVARSLEISENAFVFLDDISYRCND